MRLYRFTFATGFAIGFVAGTRAGRERYDQMVKIARDTAENPAVQQAVGAIQAQATGLFSTASHKVGGELQTRIPKMAQSAAHSVGDHLPGLKHRNGSGEADRNDASNGQSFAATTNGHPGKKRS